MAISKNLWTEMVDHNLWTFSFKAFNRDSSEEVLLTMMVEERFHYLDIAKTISDPVEDGDECGFACAANRKCFSYNLEASISVNGTRQCELLCLCMMLMSVGRGFCCSWLIWNLLLSQSLG